METYDTPVFPNFEETLRSCPLACPASRLPLPGSEEAHAMTVGSGRQCSMLFETLSPLGAFSKILLGSSHWTSSEEYCYVWERLDTKFECSAFRLTQLGQSTSDNESSLWRTPTESDVNGGGTDGERTMAAGHSMKLRDQVLTPKLWPTPTVQDGENNAGPSQFNRNSDPLNVTAVKMAGVVSGLLNPRFVEELMGFQIDHTALKRLETRLCRSKSTHSLKQSPKSKNEINPGMR